MSHGRNAVRSILLLLPFLAGPVPSRAQTCPDPGAYCEGWARDSTRREVTLTRNTLCNNGACAATCGATPITALPSIRVGTLDHVVLGFAVSDACVPECPTSPQPEPCYSIGVSYRRSVASGSENVVGTYDCDPTDPGTIVSGGATFGATYAFDGSDAINITNVIYGAGTGPNDCGAPPTALDLTGSGPSLAVQSHFTFTWTGDLVTAYTEARTYTALPPPNTVHISVSNIDYVAGTYSASAPDAVTSSRGRTWGQLKSMYR